MSVDNSRFNAKQTKFNIVYNILNLLSNLLIGILFTPYLIRHLGYAAYGFIPLSMVFSDYIGLVTQSLTSSINRFLSISINKKDYKNSNIIFNTSLIIMFTMVIVQIAIFIYPISNVELYLNIPREIKKDVIILFILMFLNYNISLLTSVFSISMYSTNRIDLMQISNLIRVIIKTIIVVALFYIEKANVSYIGVGSIVSGVICFFYSIFFWRKLTPYLNVNVKFYSHKKCKEIFSIGSWVIINQIGFLLFSKVDILIINKYLGAKSAGAYAAALQLVTVIKSVSGVFSGVVGPHVSSLYAKGNIDKIISIVKVYMVYVGYVLAITIGIIVIYAKELIMLWLGSVELNIEWVVILLLIPLVINLSVQPMFIINISTGKVKTPALVSLALGVMGVLLSIIFIDIFNFGIVSLAISSGIILTLKNAIFTPWYATKVLHKSVFDFYLIILKIIILLVLSSTITYCIYSIIKVDGYVRLFSIMTLSFIIQLPLFYFMLPKVNQLQTKDAVFRICNNLFK